MGHYDYMKLLIPRKCLATLHFQGKLGQNHLRLMWLSAAICWYTACRCSQDHDQQLQKFVFYGFMYQWIFFFCLPPKKRNRAFLFQITLKADHIIRSSLKAKTSEHRTRTPFITLTDVDIPIRSAMVKESSGVLVHGDQSVLTYIKFLGAETGRIFRGKWGTTQRWSVSFPVVACPKGRSTSCLHFFFFQVWKTYCPT